MPRTSACTLTWRAEQGQYELCEQGQAQQLKIEGEPWIAWLAAHSAFAFQGRQGRLTLLKESRARGEEGYWYAYRSLGGHTSKKYVGRGRDLTVERLEEVARALEAEVYPEANISHEAHKVGNRLPRHEETAGTLSTPLLFPKLRVPLLRSSLLPRARLLARLNAGLEHRLTLLCAPAGFGKTTLALQWIAELETRVPVPAIAWVALDGGDNDPVRFWRYVITACQELLPDLGQTSLAHLQKPPSSFESSTLEVALTIFLNELTHNARQGLLVLEDYHVIASPRIAETLAFLLDHLPPTLHLVLIARSEPTLPLAKWRARGELSEVRAADLRFSPEEAEHFLRQALALPLASETIARLETRLEGWAAGLRMATLALQGHIEPGEIEHFLGSFAGSHRPLLEYFVSEVLEAQPEPIQNFLLRTSALDRLAAPLCDAVTNRNDSASMLETLVEANLFLEPLDGARQWYRYHALFAEAMQHEAQRRLGEHELRVLSGRASLWYEQQGQFAEAIEKAFQARQLERCASLIEQYRSASRLQYVNEFGTLYRWLEQLPEAIFRQHPVLCLEYVMALIFGATSRPFLPETRLQIENLLSMAEEHGRAHNNLSTLGNVAATRSMGAWYLGKAEQSLTYARQALEWLPVDDLEGRSASLSIIGRMEAIAGHFGTARRILLETRAMCAISGNRTYARAMTNILSGVRAEQGELHEAATYLQETLAEAREQGDLDDVAHSQTGLAQLAYEWNDLETARQRAQEALEIGNQLKEPAHQANATLLLACIEHARGQTARAQQLIVEVRESAQPHHLLQIYRESQTWQARFHLASGDLSAVQRWADTRTPRDEMMPMAQYVREELLIARLWIAQGEPEKALKLLERIFYKARELKPLERIRYEAQEEQHTRGILEVQILMALAYSVQKRPQEATQALMAALSIARPAGYTRIFLDEGMQLAVLLRTTLAHTRERALSTYAQNILRAFANEPDNLSDTAHPDAALLSEPLSPQERRVLRLLAAGSSNPEIARELIVSVNTVRTQVQSIYRKLNVNNRVAASELARDLKLI